jgi:hypothetical protein
MATKRDTRAPQRKTAKPERSYRRAQRLSPSGVGGAILGGTAGAFVAGPAGAALGLVIGGAAGEALERYMPSEPERASDHA